MSTLGSDTNILSLPLAGTEFTTGTNEDWIDSLVFLINTEDVTGPQLDLRGISFEMEIRRAPPAHEVVLFGTTEDGTLSIGVPPDYGYLTISIPQEVMKMRSAAEYVGDIVATDANFTRRCVTFTLTIEEGVTRD